jgi:protein O-GlcNAc transferase
MVTSPPRLEGLYTEKFIYLPNHFFSKGHAVQGEVRPPTLEYVPRKKGLNSFQIGMGSPQENACQSPNPLGGANNNEVSFVYCNFNKFLKNNPETMRSWIRILRDVPNSILCLLEYPKEGVANLRKFVTEETAPFVDDETGGSHMNDDASDVNDRIHFIQWEWNPFDHQQRTYSLCNVMLDSHPYNGHTTAQDAYFAGVPIVTRSDGLDMSSRVTTSANVVLGLDELNAYNGVWEYETIAVRLGMEETWFKSVRAKLVESCLQKNPMHEYWDVPRYVRNFERGLKMAWDDYLDGREIDHVIVSEDGEKELRGTMEDELFTREERRRNMERYLMNDEL